MNYSEQEMVLDFFSEWCGRKINEIEYSLYGTPNNDTALLVGSKLIISPENYEIVIKNQFPSYKKKKEFEKQLSGL